MRSARACRTSSRRRAPAPSTCWPPSAATASAPCNCCRPDEPPDRLRPHRCRSAGRGGGRASAATRHCHRPRARASATTKTTSASPSPARRKRPRCCSTTGAGAVRIGATPTTHILKLPLGLVGNMRADMHDFGRERMAVRAHHVGLRPAGGALRHRALSATEGAGGASASTARCRCRRPTAMDRPPAAGRLLPGHSACPAHAKYEADGGPGMRDILRVLDCQQQRRRPTSCVRQGADGVLAAGRDRRARQELLDLPGARRRLPADAVLRRAVGLARSSATAPT